MKETIEIPRSKVLEAVLELGRNWALAVAIASAGAVAFYTETVDGPIEWEQWVPLACIFLSVIWMIIATIRFSEVASLRLRKGMLGIAWMILLFVLVTVGSGIVVQVVKFADNNQIVKICDSKMQEPESRIYKASECVRLREQRQARLDRLEGK